MMLDHTMAEKNAAATIANPVADLVRDRAKLCAAFLLGAALLFIVGFSHPQAVHDAAHDTRHSMAFPCH